MLTDEAPTEYLRRRVEARNYLGLVYPSRVHLQYYAKGATPWDEVAHVHHAEGLDAAYACNTTACLAGWLWTMPEYRAWVRTQKSTKLVVHDAVMWLSIWLGIDVSIMGGPLAIENYLLHFPFTGRMACEGDDPRKTDAEVAMDRMEALVKEAQQACITCEISKEVEPCELVLSQS